MDVKTREVIKMPRCAAKTSSNKKCSRLAVEGNIYCTQHLRTNALDTLPKMPALETDVENDADTDGGSDNSSQMHALKNEMNELRLQNSALSNALKTKEKEVKDLKAISERLSMDNSRLSEQLTDSAMSRRTNRAPKPETVARMLYYKDNKRSEEILGVVRERVKVAQMWAGDDKSIPWQWIKKATDLHFNQASSEIRMRYMDLARTKMNNNECSYMEM